MICECEWKHVRFRSGEQIGSSGEVAEAELWYLTAEPKEPNAELTRLAKIVTNRDHVAVGVWFAKTQQYPSGMYWVLVYPEDSAAHEAFWKHFYLTDDFEYATAFDKRWKRALPGECGAVR